MKTIKLLSIAGLLLFYRTSFGDIIPENTHFVDKCVKITNIGDFPMVSLLGYVSFFGNGAVPAYIISSGSCLYKGYKFNNLQIYAVTKECLSIKSTFFKKSNQFSGQFRFSIQNVTKIPQSIKNC